MSRVYSLLVIMAAIVGLDFIGIADAYAATPSVTTNWTAPDKAVDGTALTGNQAVASYQVWISTAAVPDNVTGTPTATVTSGTTLTKVVTASPGDTLHIRVQACNAFGCGQLSNEATTSVPGSVPGVPTNVTVTLSIG